MVPWSVDQCQKRGTAPEETGTSCSPFLSGSQHDPNEFFLTNTRPMDDWMNGSPCASLCNHFILFSMIILLNDSAMMRPIIVKLINTLLFHSSIIKTEFLGGDVQSSGFSLRTTLFVIKGLPNDHSGVNVALITCVPARCNNDEGKGEEEKPGNLRRENPAGRRERFRRAWWKECKARLISSAQIAPIVVTTTRGRRFHSKGTLTLRRSKGTHFDGADDDRTHHTHERIIRSCP